MSIDAMKRALEAGFENHTNPEFWDYMVVSHEALERFAAPLQERIQLLYEQLGEAEKQLDTQYKLGMEAEREACAKVVENYCGAWSDEGYALAAAIRARGNHA